MINKKILGLLRIICKSQKCCIWSRWGKRRNNEEKAKLVIVSCEASERTKDKFIKLCETYNIPLIIDGNIEELSRAIGKVNKATLAIKDENMAKQIKKIYNGGEIIG